MTHKLKKKGKPIFSAITKYEITRVLSKTPPQYKFSLQLPKVLPERLYLCTHQNLPSLTLLIHFNFCFLLL